MIKLAYGNYNTTGQGSRDPVGNPAPNQGYAGGGSMHNPGVYGAAGGGGGAGGAGVVEQTMDFRWSWWSWCSS